MYLPTFSVQYNFLAAQLIQYLKFIFTKKDRTADTFLLHLPSGLFSYPSRDLIFHGNKTFKIIYLFPAFYVIVVI